MQLENEDKKCKQYIESLIKTSQSKPSGYKGKMLLWKKSTFTGFAVKTQAK